MSIARSVMVQRLENEFKTNPDARIKCITSSHAALKEMHKSLRMFDDFPTLVDDNYLKDLSAKFENIVNSVPKELKPESPSYTLPNPLKNNIALFVSEIARMGCDELIEPQGHLNKNLCDLLEWKQEFSQRQICALLCAYVGAVYQSFIKANPKEYDLIAFTIVSDYTNKNYVNLVMQEMKRSTKVFDLNSIDEMNSIDKSIFKKLLELPKKHPRTTIGLLSTLSLLAIGGAAIFFGNHATGDTNHHSSKPNAGHKS